jgi:transcriptional regulator
MYLRPAFTVTDTGRIIGLIEANPFGLLVTNEGGAMDGSHIPFIVERADDGFVLAAHLGRANAQAELLAGGRALAVFSGPHAYITPGWYETQPSVPTWDYAAVHVHGVLEAVDDAEGACAILRRLAVHDAMGFDIDALEPKCRTAMLKGIRAFRLRPDRIEAQWKMSQNRSIADRKGVIAALRAQGDAAVAELIEATLPASA